MRYPEVVEHMAQGQVADWQMVDHRGVYIDHHILSFRLTSSINSFLWMTTSFPLDRKTRSRGRVEGLRYISPNGSHPRGEGVGPC
jgi:hypothetical protein